MRLIAIATLLLSSSAFACPNLAGKYAFCKKTSDQNITQEDIQITQTVQNRITVYQYTSTDSDMQERLTETYKADGKPVKAEIHDPDSGMSIQTSSTTSCIGDTLNLKLELRFGGILVGSMVSKMKKVGKQLIIETSGKNEDDEAFYQKEICE